MLGHPHRRNHRIEREHDVEEEDLDDDAGEGRRYLSAGVSFLALELLVDLEGALGEQEEPAAEQDDRPAGDLETGRKLA